METVTVYFKVPFQLQANHK